MSAYKTAIVRLGEAEYRRLREAEEQLRLLELQGGETRRDERSIYARMRADGRQRQAEFAGIVQSLSGEAAALEEDLGAWVQQQDAALQQRLAQAERSTTDWASQVAAELEQREQALEARFARRERQLEARLTAENEDTRAWIERAAELLAYLEQTYPLDLASANELEVQRGELDEGVRQYNAGRGERAWQAARSAWSGLTRLRHQLEGQRAALAACQQQLVRRAVEVNQRIQQRQVVRAMDAEGSQLPEELAVDFWTEGAYGALVEQAGQALEAVQSLQGADLTELGEWREELELLEERGIELVTQARLALLASQLRFNVAQIVVRALESQGFYLEEAAYCQNDFRGAFLARTRSLGGSEVLVTIDPDPGLEEGGRLKIQSGDARQVTEHELTQRNREIFQAIRQEGLDVAETRPVGRLEPESTAETQRTRRKINRID